jgi:PAS domain S-box-containing protein
MRVSAVQEPFMAGRCSRERIDSAQQSIEELVGLGGTAPEKAVAGLSQTLAHLKDTLEELWSVNEALRLADRAKAIVLDGMSELVVYQNMEGRVTWANRAAAESVGLSPQQLVGRYCYEVWHQRSRYCEGCPVVQARDTGRPQAREMTSPDGRVWFIRGYPVCDAAGQVVGLVEVTQDITEHKRAEEALRRERDLAQKYLDVAEVILLVIDANEQVRLVNRKGCGVLGHREDELIGKNWFDVCIPPRVRNDVRRVFHGLLAGKDGSLEYRENPVITKSGEERLIAWHNAVLYDEHGNMLATLSSGEDVTEHKRAEEERARVEEQLRQSRKMDALGQLASAVAHDFNNILTAILGNAEMGLTAIKQTPTAHTPGATLAALEQIRAAGERAAGLTRQLLAFGRKQPAKLTTVSLNRVIVSMESLLRQMAGERVVLEVDLGAELAPIRADPSQMEQVIMNLVINARDAMPDGGTVRIQTANALVSEGDRARYPEGKIGPHVMLAVSDTGVGMSSETLSRAFEPFFTTKPLDKGTGLGLATVYGIVKQSGGQIHVDSAPGQGATFRIYLPSVQDAEGEPIAPKSPETSAGVETVLLCDDDKLVRQLACMALRGAGYIVLEAESGKQALELAAGRTGPIHLLVCDVVLLDMNGPQLAEALSAGRPDMQMLFVSGYTAELIGKHGLRREGRNFLEKPFGAMSLLQRVREILDSVRSQS